MADIKISQLNDVQAVTNSDVFASVSGGVTVKTPATVLKKYVIGNDDISSIGDGTPTGAIVFLDSEKVAKSDIAPVEASTTSSATYAAGERFYCNNVLLEATASIDIGDTITVGTNCKNADNLETQISGLSISLSELTAENQTLTNKLNNEIKTRAILGAKNVFNPNLSTIATSANYYPNTAVTVDSDKKITVNSTSDTSGSYSYKNIVLANNDSFNLEKGIEYIISGLETDDNATYFGLFRAYDSSNNEILSVTVGSTEASFTLPSNTATYTLVLCVGRTASLSKTFNVMFCLSTDSDTTYQPYTMTNRELTEKLIIKDVSGYSWDSAIDGNKDIIVKRYGATVSIYGYFNSTTSLAQYANILSGLPHCASGASKSADLIHNTGFTLQNVDSTTSKIVVDSATTANLQYSFSFIYLADK